MEYVLLGALILGILLFTIGWLVVIVQGFQRHPLVGLFTLIPGLNLITIPALWHRVSGWVITGLIGLLMSIGAWLAGADNHLFKQLHSFGLSAAPQATATTPATPTQAAPPAQAAAPAPIPPKEAMPLALPASNTGATVPVQAGEEAKTGDAAPQQTTAETPLALPPARELPDKPLYRIVFKALPVGKLPEQIGEYVRITQTNGQQLEGKLLKASSTEITLESPERDAKSKALSQTIKLNELKDVALMMNEKNKD